MVTTNEWQSLLTQTQDLVAQDNYNFPKVDRNITQLQQYADSLRARTNKLRSRNNQIAATRLLAQQGFDAARLTQEVTSLEILPTIEDVFHADTSSVEEYLKQVEESTILAALQEAQQQTVAAFDAHMEDCMSRDWAANKRQLYGLIAPLSAGGLLPVTTTAAATTPMATDGPLIGRPLRREAAGDKPGEVRPVVQLPPLEQGYVEVVKRLHLASTSAAGFDIVSEFSKASRAAIAKSGGPETSMKSIWVLLSDMLAEGTARGATASSGNRFLDALAVGARKHLERGHEHHVHNTIVRHKVAAERGADPHPLRQIQAFLQVKLSGVVKGALDFQGHGGTGTAWMQLYYCLRNGWYDAARQVADQAQDPALARLGDGGSMRGVLEEFTRAGGKISERTALHLAHACEALMRNKTALKQQVQQPYAVLVLALLAGDQRAVEALGALLAQLGLPPVTPAIEDYMWAKLFLLQASQGGGGSAGAASPSLLSFSGGGGSFISGGGAGSLSPYTLSDMQADINRWKPAHYSKEGREPLLYVTVLLLSLQFNQALRFMWEDEMCRPYRTDAVHLGIALLQEGVLSASTAANDVAPDVSSMMHAYGRKFLHADSALALQYFMLAAQARGDGIAAKAQLLRELLVDSRDFGTLLGAGSGPDGGAIAGYVRNPDERKRLFEAVAYECQVAAQLEEAVELYLAADRPRQALAIINQQVSGLLPAAVEQEVQGAGAGSSADTLRRVMTRGRDACTRINSAGPDAGARREVSAYTTLCTIHELLLAARHKQHDKALQKLVELGFIPLEEQRVEHCSRAAQTTLHSALQERLPQILEASATTIASHKASLIESGASREKLLALRAKLEALCMFANNISFRVPRPVFQQLSETLAGFSG